MGEAHVKSTLVCGTRLVGLAGMILLGAGCRPESPQTHAAQPPGQAPVEAAKARSAQAAPKPPDAEKPPPAPGPASEPASLWTRSQGSDWPYFLGPSQDGHSPERGILTRWGPRGLRVVWHRRLGTSYGAPTVARGRLLQFDRFGDRARLYCLHAETGQELWRYEYPTDYEDLYGYNNGPRCSPITDGQQVYAYGAEGVLVCCRLDDGRRVWQRNLQEEFGVVQNFFGVGSNPVVAGDLLLVMVGGSPPASRRVPPGALDRVETAGSAIVALDKHTGQVRYQIGDELASYASLKLATIDARAWCFAFCRGGLLAFEPQSGQIDFHYPWRAAILESVNASTPVVVGNEVLISETYGPGSSLLRVAPGRYEVVWKDDQRQRSKSLQTHWNTPVYQDGFVYACSGRHSENATLRCVEWKTGRVRWELPGLARTSLTAIDGHLLCLGEFGQLWLFRVSPDQPEEVAMVDYGDPQLGQPLLGEAGPVLEYPCWAAPVVAHGLLYLRGKDRLVCLELIPQP